MRAVPVETLVPKRHSWCARPGRPRRPPRQGSCPPERSRR
jgi:hypothetical protein